MSKTALILSGGGMKASFTVGVLMGLTDEGKSPFVAPDILIAGSGSAGTGAYFLSQQYDSIRNIRLNLLSTKKCVNFSRFWKIIDIDYIIDDIFSVLDPLEQHKVTRSSTDFYIPAFNKKTGRIDYLLQDGSRDLMESLRATKAMPIAYRPSPSIQVGESYYCDSILSSQGRHHIMKAVELGASDILLIENQQQSGLPTRDEKVFHLWMKTLSGNAQKSYAAEGQKRQDFALPDTCKLNILSPSEYIHMGSLDNKREALASNMQYGRDSYRERRKMIDSRK